MVADNYRVLGKRNEVVYEVCEKYDSANNIKFPLLFRFKNGDEEFVVETTKTDRRNLTINYADEDILRMANQFYTLYSICREAKKIVFKGAPQVFEKTIYKGDVAEEVSITKGVLDREKMEKSLSFTERMEYSQAIYYQQIGCAII